MPNSYVLFQFGHKTADFAGLVRPTCLFRDNKATLGLFSFVATGRCTRVNETMDAMTAGSSPLVAVGTKNQRHYGL